jgi:hypothetical protein
MVPITLDLMFNMCSRIIVANDAEHIDADILGFRASTTVFLGGTTPD